MRKQAIIILISLSIFAQAQMVQKGRVVKQNSGNKGIELTSIMLRGAAPTTSDQEGYFSATYTKAYAGEPLIVVEIHKTGYEIVNYKEINQWSLSSSKELHIVMCHRGMLDQSRRQYYKIGEDIYKKRYENTLAKLKRLQADNKIDAANYEQRVNEANEQLQRLLNSLEQLSDNFARINKDTLSELDRKALQLFESGDIDGAINLYEDSEIISMFKEGVVIRDSLRKKINLLSPTLQKELEILLKSKQPGDQQRADSISKLINTLK